MENTTKPRPFLDTLRQIRNGRFLDDLTDELAELNEAVGSTGKVGTLTITLKLKPLPGTDATQADIIPKVDCKLPKRDQPATRFYLSGKALHIEDPHQKKLDGLEVVEAPAKDLEVSNA